MKKKIKYKIIYMCDDNVGFIWLMQKETSLTEEQLNLVLEELINKKYIEKGRDEYFTTDRGKEYLIKKGGLKKRK